MFQTETVQRRVYKSLKLWSMYADLEESLGTFQVIIHVVAVIKDCGEFPFSIREMHSLPAAWKLASCMFRFHVADVFCMCSGHILNLKRKDLESLYVCDDQSKYRILNIRR